MIGRTASFLRCWFLGLLLVTPLVPTGRAFAQASFVNKGQGMDAHLFRPAVDSKGFISVNGTSVLGDRDYSFGLVLDMGLGIFPLHLFEYDPGKTPDGANRDDRLIKAAVTGTLH